MAEGTIDKLSIEVSSTASVAVRDIRELSGALTELERGIGGNASKLTRLSKGVRALKDASASLRASDIKQLSALNELNNVKISSTVSKNLAKISTALSFMPTDSASRLAGIRYLKSLDGLKLSSTVPNNLAKLGKALMSFPMDADARLRNLTLALVPLRGLQGLNLDKTAKSLRKLPEALAEYAKLDVSRLVQQLDSLNPRLLALARSATALKAAYAGMPNSLQSVARATRSVTSANRALAPTQERNNRLFDQGSGILTKFHLSVGLITGAIHLLKRAFTATIGEVNTYIENMNLFEASMGQYTKSATEFGQKVQDMMGIDFGAWARNQGVFQTLMTGMGETADRASVMSQQLTQLGYDISSFYNISVEDAMLKIQSGIAGELEPLRRLGWDLSNARMQLEASKLGIDANVQSMTQAEKVGLRYYLIMNQVTQVHGDMARTIASPANQLRVLQAQLTLAARAIGELFIPMLNKILPYAIAAAKAVRMLAQELANFLGIDAKFEVDYSGLDTSGIATGAEEEADALDDVADSAEKAKKKVQEYKNTVMGFDELHKLNDVPEQSDDDGDTGADAGNLNGSGFQLPIDTYDFMAGLDDYITKLSDNIASKMVGALKKVVPVVAGIGAGIAAWKIGSALLKNADKLGKLLGTAGGNAKVLGNRLKGMKFGGAIGKQVSNLGNKLLGISGTLGTIAKFPAVAMPAIAGIAAVIAIMVARTADLWINSKKFRDGVGKIVEWIGMIPDLLAKLPNPLEVIRDICNRIGEAFGNFLKSIGIDPAIFKPITDAINGVIDLLENTLGGVIDALDLDIADLGITALGAFLVFGPTGPIGKALGAALLVFEAITVAIRAIGWATEPCVESVDALAGVSEDTAKRFGTSLQSMEDATRELDELDFSNSVVSEEDVESIERKILDIHDTIVDNLNGERNRELAELHSMAGIFTEEEIAATEARIKQFYDDEIAAANGGTDEINSILETAAAENRALTEEESRRINEIKDAMYQQLIEKSGAAEADLDKIRQAMKNNDEAAALEAASTAIKAAQDRVDSVTEQAEKEYDDTMKWAKQMLDANEITQERYDQIEQDAEAHKNDMIQKAKDEYDATIKETEEKLGDLKDKIDINTGEIKSNWDIFWGDVSKSTGTWLGSIKDDYQKWEKETGESLAGFWKDVCDGWDGFWGDVSKNAGTWLGDIKKDYQQWESDVSQGWNSFTSDLGSAWEGFCNDFSSWWNNDLDPTKRSIVDAFEAAGIDIKGFMADPVTAIKDAWQGLKDWFYDNVVHPLENLFSGIDLQIPAPKLPQINWNWLNIESGDGSTYSIPEFTGVTWFANGGFPTSGQLFMARENGLTELVGTMGGKSAVANNQQIVEGIEQGVMSAMIQVLPSFQSNQGEGDVTLVVNIDGQELARAEARGRAQAARRGQLKPEFQFV